MVNKDAHKRTADIRISNDGYITRFVSVASSTLYIFDPLEYYYYIRQRCDGGEFPALQNGIQYNNILKIKINRKTQNLLKERKAPGCMACVLFLSPVPCVCVCYATLYSQHTQKKCEGSSSARREKGTLKTCFAYTYIQSLIHLCYFIGAYSIITVVSDMGGASRLSATLEDRSSSSNSNPKSLNYISYVNISLANLIDISQLTVIETCDCAL